MKPGTRRVLPAQRFFNLNIEHLTLNILMQTNFNLDNFISTYVTKRAESLLADDLIKYNTELNKRINGKKVLVIGGAGTIGSSYI
ncbi:MAG: hypothetical protein Q8T08_06955, partial [Ignavibacteria bacterium]|nr:hypothetical protein [Ignavibacteria bacterium]